jgi:putative ABC transport system permease protein
MLALARLLPLRALRARPLRSLLSAIGIGAGVALVLAIQLINAAITDSIRGSVDAVAGRAAAEVVGPAEGGVPLEVVTRLKALPDAEAAVGLLRADGVAYAGSRRVVVTVLGVGADVTSLAPPGEPVRLDGNPLTLSRGLVVSESLAARLHIGLGGRMQVTARAARLDREVTGILRGGPLAAGDVALLPLDAAMSAFGVDAVDAVLVVPRTGVAATELRRAVHDAVPSTLTVREPLARVAQTDKLMRGLRQLLTLASTVALFVGVFVVYNTMTMATTERRRELALLRALGLRRRDEARLLYVEAGALGVAGGVFGLAGGVLLARVLVARVASGYAVLVSLPPVHVHPRAGLLGLAFAAGLAASLVASVLPARRIRLLPPVEGMRAGAPTEDVGEAGRWTGRRAAAVALPSLALGAAAMAVFILRRAAVGWAVVGLAGLLGALAAAVPVVVPWVVRRGFGPLLARSPLVGRLAGDSMLRTPRRTSYTVGSLLITLMLVVGMGGALGSFRASLDRLIGVTARADVYVVPRDEFTTSLPSRLIDDVRASAAVQSAWRFRISSVLWDGQAVALETFDMAAYRQVGSLLLTAGDVGRAFDAQVAGTGIVVSEALAADRDLKVGDPVTLPSGSATRTPPGGTRMTVVGIATDFLPQGAFYLDWRVAERLYGDPGAASFGVVAKRGQLTAAREQVASVMRDHGVDVRLQTRRERAANVTSGIDRTFALADGVQLAGLLVAAIAVVNTLLMTVVERRREIGVLRALGLLRRQVRRLILTEAAVMGVVGGSLAAVSGYALSLLIIKAMEVGNRWTQVPYVPWPAMLLAPVGAAAVAVVGGVWPARRAAATHIVDAIRSE